MALALAVLGVPGPGLIDRTAAATEPELRITTPMALCTDMCLYGATFLAASTDGSFVYFSSNSDFAPQPGSPYASIWLWVAGRVIRVAGSHAHAFFEGSSQDGTRAYFETTEQLVPEDTDQASDLYQWSVTGGYRLITPGPGTGRFRAETTDGSKVVFDTNEQLTPDDTDQGLDVYEWQLDKGISLLSPGSTDQQALFLWASADLSRVFFVTDEGIAGDPVTQGVYEVAGGPPVLRAVDADVTFASDGDRIYFSTMRAMVPEDTDGDWDAYMSDAAGFHLLTDPAIGFTAFDAASADGSRLVISSTEQLSGADTNAAMDLYLMAGGPPVLLSQGDGGAYFAAADAQLSVVLYFTTSTLAPADTNNGATDLYRWRADTPTVPALISGGRAVNPSDTFRGASADRMTVVFSSWEQLDPSDTNQQPDVYERTPDGSLVMIAPPSNPGSYFGSISADGSRVMLSDARAADRDVTPPNATASVVQGPADHAVVTFGATLGPAIWFDCIVDGQATPNCTSPLVLNGLADGVHLVAVQAWDAASNGDPTPASLTIDVEHLPPSVSAPTDSLAAGVDAAAATAFVRVGWAGSDAGSGIASYDLALSLDARAYAVVWSGPASAVRVSVPIGHSYRFRVRAHDKAGNTSGWATGSAGRVHAFSETSRLIRYSSAWRGAWSSSYLGGADQFATRHAATAVFSVTGRSVAWVAATGPSRGSVRIYVDGHYLTTVNLHAASSHARKVVWSMHWTTSGTHIVELWNVASAGHPRVDVDEFQTIT